MPTSKEKKERMTDTHFDPSILAQFAETFDPNAVAETEDYSPAKGVFRPTGPGEFTNPSRTILASEKNPSGVLKNDDGTVSIQFSLEGGLDNGNGSISDTKFPLRAYVSSRPFSQEGDTGMTSSLAEYMKSVGIPVAGRGVAELLALLPETLNLPARVYITWTDKAVKQSDGSWKSANLKLRDFQTGGDRKNPVYSPSVTKDGVTYTAKSKVSRFIAPRG